MYNQKFVPPWNAIYNNLITKVSKSIITANVYKSPISQMLQDMETGQYVEDIHINPSAVMLQDTVSNSDIFTDYTDDIVVANYQNYIDLVFPSTYTEYVVKTSFTMIENVSQLISALTSNIRTTLEYNRTNLFKQMLYNYYQFGMLSSVVIDDPATDSGKLVVAMNQLIDDFSTEINPRNVIYNNQVGILPTQKRQTITTDFPYVILFNEYIRDVEFYNAINLALIDRFKTGNNNEDYARKLIKLNKEDFPNSIPPINRSEVTGTNVSAKDVNFFEMPTDENGDPLFSGTPTGGNTIVGFVIDPQVIKLFTQLSITTSWLNPATLKNTNREIYRGIMELGAFNKICAITYNA